jgi:hypothetical protein
MTQDQFQADLQLIYGALGGDETAVPPADVTDKLNWWASQINELISGDVVPSPPANEPDPACWWLQTLYEGLTGDVIDPPKDVEKLEWWFQQIHEFYTGESGVVPPDPVEGLDEFHWWLMILLEDIYNSGVIPWRFSLHQGELQLDGDTLPASFSLSANGELTVDDTDLPIEFTNWRVMNGRLYADEVA